MRPVDKFGQPIFSGVFERMLAIGRQLERLGYVEKKRLHPEGDNLFVRTYPYVSFYADLRSSDVVPIWEDTRALLYWFWKPNAPELEIRQRMVLLEWARLGSVPRRLSFEVSEGTAEERELIYYLGHDNADVVPLPRHMEWWNARRDRLAGTQLDLGPLRPDKS